MKTIIAGGRGYQFTEQDIIKLQDLNMTKIISGGAKGADKGGEDYGDWYNIPVEIFPADWKRYGKGAGFLRNEEMAKHADAVVLFPGGKGTDHMYRTAVDYDLLIFDWRK